MWIGLGHLFKLHIKLDAATCLPLAIFIWCSDKAVFVNWTGPCGRDVIYIGLEGAHHIYILYES